MTRSLCKLAVVLLLLVPLPALAQQELEQEYHKNIKVFQLKPVMKTNRVQLQAFGAVSLTPRMVFNWGGGGAVDYHINEQWSVGAQFTQFLSSPTALKQEIEERFGVFPERSEVGYGGTVRVAVTPVFGKFSHNFMPYWDASIFLGGGITHTVLTPISPTIEAGLGFRFFIGRGIAITGEVLDSIYWEDFTYKAASQSEAQGYTALQNWMVRAGVAFFIPFSFTYEGGK
ncbi:MAG: outer membrane beta-barrel domain-containing protein [Deltaproteobacteria bacterium]|nr:outer membrane beta-barrel domain-containing protein [Deltaproteobacteria bacterium]